jgi:alpha-tubulin suppressor-like RCC1 family protein
MEKKIVMIGVVASSCVAVGAIGAPQATIRPGSLAIWGGGEAGDPANEEGNFGQSVLPREPSPLPGVPATNVLLYRGILQASAGSFHTAIVLSDGTVKCWGAGATGPSTYPNLGQAFPPANLTDAIQVSAGAFHTIALRANGLVQCWGAGSAAAIDPATVGFAQSVVPPTATEVVEISAGGYHSMVRKVDGSVVCWGAGQTTAGSFPNYGQSIVPIDLIATRIAAGGLHSVAIRPDTTVVCWGSNIKQQCNVPLGLTGVIDIAAGSDHTVALKGDGTVVCWGWNTFGQSTVPAGLQGVVAVGAGDEHTIARLADGLLVAWGNNASGQCNVPAHLDVIERFDGGRYNTLAIGHIETVVETWGLDADRQVSGTPGALGEVIDVAAGGFHSMVLQADGTILAWGRNFYGQVDVPTGLGPVVEVAAGLDHSMALKQGGTVAAWGRNSSGQCNVPPGLVNVVQIAAGRTHSLARRADNTVVAWGYNVQGQASVPASLAGQAVFIAGGGYHSAAVRADGTVVCWGAGTVNSGFPNFGQSIVPANLANVTAVAAGLYHTVALRDTGTVVAWGSNSHGQCSIPPNFPNDPEPLAKVRSIAAGDYHTMAACFDGKTRSWGAGEISILPPNFRQARTPGLVPAGPVGRAVDVAAGGFHSIALLDADNDGDLVVNDIDNCLEVFNPNQADLNQDGVGDACACGSGPQLDPLDLDNDLRLCDNCPNVFNPNQEDTDSDGVGDVCDNCLTVANPSQADGDLDTVGNACDNCVADANLSQADIDGNGVGNACDLAVFLGWVADPPTNLPNGRIRVKVRAQLSGAGGRVLNVFQIHGPAGALAAGNFQHVDAITGNNPNAPSTTSGTWDPKSLQAANAAIDSWVSVGEGTGGNLIGSPLNTTQADGGWGPPGLIQPGIPDSTSGGVAGWFNGNPANQQGKVDPVTLRTVVGSFVTGVFYSHLLSMSIGFNRSLGDDQVFFGSGIFQLGDPTGDFDFDGIQNQSDNCPALSNSGQADCDANGVGDGCDLDANLNGVTDACEPSPLVFNVGGSGPFATVQGAINAASSGAIIRIAPGTYVGNIDFFSRNLVVEGASTTQLTILEAAAAPPPPQLASPVVKIAGGQTAGAVLRNVVVRSGRGGISFALPTNVLLPTLTGPFIGGAGIAVSGSSPTIENVVVENCDIRRADLKGVGGGALFLNSFSVVNQLTVRSSLANEGGGIAVVGGVVDLLNINLEDNVAVNRGAGLLVTGGDTLVVGATIASNGIATPPTERGGGVTFIYNRLAPPPPPNPPPPQQKLDLQSVSITGNFANRTGGLYVQQANTAAAGVDNTALLLAGTVCDNSANLAPALPENPNPNFNLVLNATPPTFVDNGSVICSCNSIGDIAPLPNGDNVINSQDLTALLANWDRSGVGDLNGDGIVGPADLSIMLSSWGACP